VAAETGFMIDGQLYEVPGWDTFTMDEAQVLFDYTGFTIEDVAADPDETDEAKEERTERFKNPGLLRAFMHIAYQRGNKDVKPARVKTLIGSANLLDSLEAFASKKDGEDEEGDESPPVSTTEPAPSSPSRPVEQNTSSGSGSETSSDQQDETQERTGTIESDMSSTSDRLSSVA
jgi:hypothetical protein